MFRTLDPPFVGPFFVDERPDGVYLSYDRMARFLKPFRNTDAVNVAQNLDAKVEALLGSAAAYDRKENVEM